MTHRVYNERAGVVTNSLPVVTKSRRFSLRDREFIYMKPNRLLNEETVVASS